MKKSIAAFLCMVGFISTAQAYDGNHNRRYQHHPHQHYHHSDRWVGPMLGGILIGVAVAKANEQAQQPVVIDRVPYPVDAPPVYRMPPAYQTYPCLIPYIDPVTGHKRHEYVLCVR